MNKQKPKLIIHFKFRPNRHAKRKEGRIGVVRGPCDTSCRDLVNLVLIHITDITLCMGQR